MAGKVSVIIPTYNRASYLKEAIESVFEQEGEHLLEVIVVDDGSTDETAEMLKGMNVRYFYQENRGVGAARNVGATVAKGKYLAFLDSDDLWHKNKLTKQLKLIEEKQADMVFSSIQHFRCPRAKKNHTQSMNPMPGIFALTLLIKRDSFLKTEGFSEKIKIGEFIDWYSRAKSLGLTDVIHPEVLAYRRIHDSNLTTENRPSLNEYASVLKKHLERKRGAAA